jgi:predicted transcriptional regulator
MKIINIIILLIGLAGGGFGTKFIQNNKLQKIERAYQKELSSKVDTLLTLRQNIRYFVSQDSLKSELITQMQATMNVLKKENTLTKRRNQACEAWKADAQDGVVTDTIKVKRKLFGGYRIIN